ncbi:phosphate signaling complex protein PhoU [Bosea sp. 2KB_26]|uniref:phosphate signaling complex protein PhoU n=1 Tax=unclassified Bosea (in: a-proteobacteria) TaxID=2653178 RepID=UPI000853023C|nr:phosphate signaling complex protein PhoU [Bosea sp. BIWAKO-01]GAU81708.1 phosphate transport system regulatory protein PhoU [Bosea sp. BIWAKO-01]
MTDHIVRSYDADLEGIRRSLAEMGGMSERMLGDSTVALVRRDTGLAQKVISADQRLDNLQREVEEKAVLTIARRQPLANDLRELISAIRIAADIERVGDLAKNIAKRAVAISGQFQPPSRAVVGLEHMSRLVQAQLKDVLDAYAVSNEQKAMEVWRRDDEIDALYTSLFRELLTYMMEDPRNITFCTHLLFCAKNVERIGDHTTNIAETIHYLVTGEALDAARPKLDTTNILLDAATGE